MQSWHFKPRQLILDCIYLFSNICTICDTILYIFLDSSFQLKDSSSEEKWSSTPNAECITCMRWNLTMRWGKKNNKFRKSKFILSFPPSKYKLCWFSEFIGNIKADAICFLDQPQSIFFLEPGWCHIISVSTKIKAQY